MISPFSSVKSMLPSSWSLGVSPGAAMVEEVHFRRGSEALEDIAFFQGVELWRS